jgi:hypothetical protein
VSFALFTMIVMTYSIYLFFDVSVKQCTYRCLKSATLKLLYGVQNPLIGEGKIFKKFLVFISLHNGSFCKDF